MIFFDSSDWGMIPARSPDAREPDTLDKKCTP